MCDHVLTKSVITALLAGWWISGCCIGYVAIPVAEPAGTVADYGVLYGMEQIVRHLVFPLSHGNVFHLLANLLCLWVMPGRLYLGWALLVSFFSSWMPVMSCHEYWTWTDQETVGLSGVLFAIIGIKWGLSGQLRRFVTVVMPFVVAGALLPSVNWWLHLYCAWIGYFVGRAESEERRVLG